MSEEYRYVEPSTPLIYCNNSNSAIELPEELLLTASILAKIRDEIKQQYTGCGLINDGLDIAIGIVENHLKEINDESD